MAPTPPPPCLTPAAVEVWGITSENHEALRKLRDFQPSAGTDANMFLRDCQALAHQLLKSPNLKDCETNALAALRPSETDPQSTQPWVGWRRPWANLNVSPSPEMGGALVVLPGRRIKIPNPPNCTKSRAEYRVFKTKLQEKIRGKADRFFSDDLQLVFAMGILGEEAHEMVSPLRQSGET